MPVLASYMKHLKVVASRHDTNTPDVQAAIAALYAEHPIVAADLMQLSVAIHRWYRADTSRTFLQALEIFNGDWGKPDMAGSYTAHSYGLMLHCAHMQAIRDLMDEARMRGAIK